MDILFQKPLQKTSYGILREAGYIPILDRASGKQSYVSKITQARYPRFHVYIEEEKDDLLKLHLHLDHKRHGWGERLHDTEYEGEQVDDESARIERWLNHYAVKDDQEEKSEEDESFSGKKETFLDFIAKLFG